MGLYNCDKMFYMNIEDTHISGVKIITLTLHGDDRGFFVENYAQTRYEEIIGKEHKFVQDNVSRSQKGVLRGLHFQDAPFAQGKLVSVLSGSVYDVAVDIRKNSPTFGQYVGIELRAPERNDIGEWYWQQFWIAPGLAHGFLTLEEDTLFAYKCTNLYAPDYDGGVKWDDPDVGVDWPSVNGEIIVSEKDQKLPYLKDLYACA